MIKITKNLASVLSFELTGLNSQGCSLVYPAAFDGRGVKSMKPIGALMRYGSACFCCFLFSLEALVRNEQLHYDAFWQEIIPWLLWQKGKVQLFWEVSINSQSYLIYLVDFFNILWPWKNIWTLNGLRTIHDLDF